MSLKNSKEKQEREARKLQEGALRLPSPEQIMLKGKGVERRESVKRFRFLLIFRGGIKIFHNRTKKCYVTVPLPLMSLLGKLGKTK